MRVAQLAEILLVLVCSYPYFPVVSRADDTEKSEIAKIEQTTRVSLLDCLREEFSSLSKKVPDGGDALEWKDDWTNIVRDCRWLEIELSDVRKVNLDSKSLEYVNSDKPTIRVVLPVTEKSLLLQKKSSNRRMVSLMTAEVGSVKVNKNKNGDIVSKTLVVNIDWSDLNANGIRVGAVGLTDFGLSPFTITINAKD